MNNSKKRVRSVAADRVIAVAETGDAELTEAREALARVRSDEAKAIAQIDLELAGVDQLSAEGRERAAALHTAKKRVREDHVNTTNRARYRVAKAVARLESEARFARLIAGESTPADYNHLDERWSTATPALRVLYKGLAEKLQRFPCPDELRDLGSDFANVVAMATGEALKRRVQVERIPGMAPVRSPQRRGEAVARERVERFVLENARLPNRSEVLSLFPEPISDAQVKADRVSKLRKPDGSISLAIRGSRSESCSPAQLKT